MVGIGVISFLELILEKGEVSVNDAAHALGLTPRSIRRYANVLIDINLILKVQINYRDEPIYKINTEYMLELISKHDNK